jgi:hypothetical protein
VGAQAGFPIDVRPEGLKGRPKTPFGGQQSLGSSQRGRAVLRKAQPTSSAPSLRIMCSARYALELGFLLALPLWPHYNLDVLEPIQLQSSIHQCLSWRHWQFQSTKTKVKGHPCPGGAYSHLAVFVILAANPPSGLLGVRPCAGVGGNNWGLGHVNK